MNENDFNNFATLIKEKNQNIVSYNDALSLLSDGKIDKNLE